MFYSNSDPICCEDNDGSIHFITLWLSSNLLRGIGYVGLFAQIANLRAMWILVKLIGSTQED